MGSRVLSGVVGVVMCATVLAVLPATAQASGSAAPTVSAPDRPTGVLVRLVRSGGIAGTVDRVSVTTNGLVRVRRDAAPVAEFRLGRRQLERLRTTLAAAHLRRLAPDYPAPGADMFAYALTSGGVTVTATETAVPPVLRPLIGTLMGYLTPR